MHLHVQISGFHPYHCLWPSYIEQKVWCRSSYAHVDKKSSSVIPSMNISWINSVASHFLQIPQYLICNPTGQSPTQNGDEAGDQAANLSHRQIPDDGNSKQPTNRATPKTERTRPVRGSKRVKQTPSTSLLETIRARKGEVTHFAVRATQKPPESSKAQNRST